MKEEMRPGWQDQHGNVWRMNDKLPTIPESLKSVFLTSGRSASKTFAHALTRMDIPTSHEKIFSPLQAWSEVTYEDLRAGHWARHMMDAPIHPVCEISWQANPFASQLEGIRLYGLVRHPLAVINSMIGNPITMSSPWGAFYQVHYPEPAKMHLAIDKANFERAEGDRIIIPGADADRDLKEREHELIPSAALRLRLSLGQMEQHAQKVFKAEDYLPKNLFPLRIPELNRGMENPLAYKVRHWDMKRADWDENLEVNDSVTKIKELYKAASACDCAPARHEILRFVKVLLTRWEISANGKRRPQFPIEKLRDLPEEHRDFFFDHMQKYGYTEENIYG